MNTNSVDCSSFERAHNPVFVLSRFSPENFYHDLVESKIPIFSYLLNTGLFDTKKLGWRETSLFYNFRLIETVNEIKKRPAGPTAGR